MTWTWQLNDEWKKQLATARYAADIAFFREGKVEFLTCPIQFLSKSGTFALHRQITFLDSWKGEGSIPYIVPKAPWILTVLPAGRDISHLLPREQWTFAVLQQALIYLDKHYAKKFKNMNTSSTEVMSMESIQRLRKKLQALPDFSTLSKLHITGRATKAWTDSQGYFCLQYHNTIVWQSRYNKAVGAMQVFLNTGGHFSMTTKARMNQAANICQVPLQVTSSRGMWVIAVLLPDQESWVEYHFANNIATIFIPTKKPLPMKPLLPPIKIKKPAMPPVPKSMRAILA